MGFGRGLGVYWCTCKQSLVSTNHLSINRSTITRYEPKKRIAGRLCPSCPENLIVSFPVPLSPCSVPSLGNVGWVEIPQPPLCCKPCAPTPALPIATQTFFCTACSTSSTALLSKPFLDKQLPVCTRLGLSWSWLPKTYDMWAIKDFMNMGALWVDRPCPAVGHPAADVCVAKCAY